MNETKTRHPNCKTPKEGRMGRVIKVNKGLFKCETCPEMIVRAPGMLQRFCSKKCRKNRK